MSPHELFRAGKLTEAIQALGGELRNHPTDRQRRTFLFELLCLSGDFLRAEKHLNILADGGEEAITGALVYRSALHADRQRHAFFDEGQYRVDTPPPVSGPGKLNGVAFETIEDADERIGPRLEMFVAGEYQWLPFAHLGTLNMEAPRRLRDTLWTASLVTAGPALQGKDFGQVLLPVIYPGSGRHERDTVRMGRETDWLTVNESAVPMGQKLLLLDGETVIPFLEVRELEMNAAAAPLGV